MWQRRAGRVENALHVDGHHVVPVLQRRFGRGRRLHQAGVVHQGVEPSELRDCAPHGGRDLIGVRDVGRDDERCATGGFDLGFQLRQPVGAAREESYRRSLGGQRFGRRRTDATAGTRHQGRGVRQCRHDPPVDWVRSISCRT